MKKILLYSLLLISFASFGQFTATQLHTGVTNNIRPGLSPFKVANQLDSMIRSLQIGLVSGTNIKTINGTSILGSGNLVTGGITNSATNNEFMKSDGTNAIGSKWYNTSAGVYQIGDVSTSGNKTISAISSSGNTSLNIEGQGTGSVNLRTSSADILKVNPTTLVSTVPTTVQYIPATNTNVEYLLTLDRETFTGSGIAVGIGVGTQYKVQTSNGGTIKIGATDEILTTNIGSGTETFDRVIKVMTSGAAASEVLRVNANGISTNGTQFVKFITGSATLDFPNTTASNSSDLTITVTGAVVGEVCTCTPPNGSVAANSIYTCWVSASNTVTVRFSNLDILNAANPASNTFKAIVFKF
jgi:hypothetical protein